MSWSTNGAGPSLEALSARLRAQPRPVSMVEELPPMARSAFAPAAFIPSCGALWSSSMGVSGRTGSVPNGLSYSNHGNEIRIVVKPTRLVTVRVKDAAGRPVVGAAVTAAEYTYQTVSTTGTDGIATLRVAADARILWVMGQKPGVGFDYFENHPTYPSRDTPNLPEKIDLTLGGAQTVKIKTIDSKGRPLQEFDGYRAPYCAWEYRLRGPCLNPRSWVMTDAGASLSSIWLPKHSSEFSFDLDRGAYSAAFEQIRHEQRDGTEFTVRLLHATELSGTVRLPDGRPASGILIRTQGRGLNTGGTDREQRPTVPTRSPSLPSRLTSSLSMMSDGLHRAS